MRPKSIQSCGIGPIASWSSRVVPIVHVRGYVPAIQLVEAGYISSSRLKHVSSSKTAKEMKPIHQDFDQHYAMLLREAKGAAGVLSKHAAACTFIHVTELPNFLFGHCLAQQDMWDAAELRRALQDPSLYTSGIFSEFFRQVQPEPEPSSDGSPLGALRASGQQQHYSDGSQLGALCARGQAQRYDDNDTISISDDDAGAGAAAHVAAGPAAAARDAHVHDNRIDATVKSNLICANSTPEGTPMVASKNNAVLQSMSTKDASKNNAVLHSMSTKDDAGDYEGSMPWNPQLAATQLASGRIGAFSLPKPSMKVFPRRRIGVTTDLMQNTCHKLREQLNALEMHFLPDINAARERPAFKTKTWTNFTSVIRVFLGWAHNQAATGNEASTSSNTANDGVVAQDLCLELVLSPRRVREFLLEFLGPRRVALVTMVNYVSCILQLFKALKGLNMPHAHGPLMEQLVAELKAVNTQLQHKCSQVASSRRMLKAEVMSEALAANDMKTLSTLPGPLKYGLLIEFTEDISEQWLCMYARIPSTAWTGEQQLNPTEQHNLIVVAVQLVVCWWRSVQIGTDIPPLRPCVVWGLMMPHSYPCTEPSCSMPRGECFGNHVKMAGSATVFYTPHHKTEAHVETAIGGTMKPTPPEGSLTNRLTTALVRHALPLIYSKVPNTPEAVPLPMLPDIFVGREGSMPITTGFGKDGPVFNSSSYGQRFQEHCVGKKTYLPKAESNILSTLRLVECPCPTGSFCPMDCRRHFVTSVVEFKQHVFKDTTCEPDLKEALQALAARQIGNRVDQWVRCYDQMVFVREGRIAQAIMGSLREKLHSLVRHSGLARPKRGSLVAGLKRASEQVLESKSSRRTFGDV